MGTKVRIDPGWPRFRRRTWAPAVRKGNMVFISGTAGTDEEGNLVGPGDVVAQTAQIYKKIGQLLAEAGATWDDVVWTTDYLVIDGDYQKTMDNYKRTADIRRQYFGTNFPASTAIIVEGLVSPDCLIEIEAIAVLGD